MWTQVKGAVGLAGFPVLVMVVILAYYRSTPAQSRRDAEEVHKQKLLVDSAGVVDLAGTTSTAPSSNKRVCVLGAVQVHDWKVYPDTEKIGKLIAELGFDLITGGVGGNMDVVRQAFFNAKKDGQKSIWAPSEDDKRKNVNPSNVDERLEASNLRPEVTTADMVIALPGYKRVALEIKMAQDNNKPCFGVLPPDSEMDEKKRQVNKHVKDALQKSGFKFVDDMDWDKDVQQIKAFLKAGSGASAESDAESDTSAESDVSTESDDSKKSSAFSVVPGSVLAFLTLGLLAIV